MEVFHRKHFTRIALTYLEEVVLDILHEAGKPLRAADICHQMDIPRTKHVNRHYPLGDAILDRLASKGLVRQLGTHEPWSLTEKATEE